MSEIVEVESAAEAALVEVEVSEPAVVEAVVLEGPPGPEGPPGQWTQLTQAEYDALSPPDPDTLYVIIG